MRSKRIPNLFSLRRLRLCRKLFVHPYQVFWRTCLFTHQPFVVEFLNGQSVLLSRRAGSEVLWDWLFTSGVQGWTMTGGDEYQIDMGSTIALIRPNGSDWATLKEVFFTDVYRIKSLEGPLGNVVDLGANVGYFTSAMLDRAKRVVAVEASRETFEQAVKQVALNGGDTHEVLHRAVTGRTGGIVKIHHGDIRNAASYSIDESWTNHFGTGRNTFEEVGTVSLTDLLDGQRLDAVDLLKCDVEGAEFEIFLNTPVATLQRIRRMFIEVHVSEIHPVKELEQLISHLETAGFHLENDNVLGQRTEGALFTQVLFFSRADTTDIKAGV
ncbi:MAG: FkbM family methyltransferase [Verrucomicrobia bacterium]|nr:FkbM family methyltransferase [Verrucomicrobiota bacterium]